MATSISELNISGLTFYDPAAPKATAAADMTSTKDLQSNFLRLLTVQLQNQDPMNPMESAEMTSQLAQLNMVDGINTMNKNINNMISQMQTSSFLNQASTVGKSALVNANTIKFDGTNPVVLGANFASPVTSTNIKITDSSGKTVMDQNVGASPQGISNLYWDGLDINGQPLPAGTYFLQISGLSGTNTISAQTLVSSPVMAVGRNGVDLSLVLADGRRVTPSDVVQWVAQ
jgi:flagellar basal-body rod modification protein FlgD